MTKLVNRAKMTTATTGTGTITLGSAVDGYQTFAAAGVSDADVVSYVIEDGVNWEIGSGTYTATGTTLSRTVSESSNAGSAINLSGEAVVFISALVSDIQQPPSEGAFVDGDKTKLDGIEAGADVTDTANVTAAGALMDSEVTNLAAVKAFNPADYATAAQGSLADTATQPGDNISTLTNDAGYTTNIGDITGVTAGGGITGGGTSGTVTVSHADTSAQGSVNNSGATVIQDVTLDTYGHVTALGSTTLTASTIGALPTGGGTITGNLFLDSRQIYGGFGAETTGGVNDWNDASNARSGNGYTLLNGNDTNGPTTGSEYYHPFSFEYSSKNGTGNMTQLAIPYNGDRFFFRRRVSGAWTSWYEIWNSNSDGAGSGLDADLLDGQHASSFASSTTQAQSTWEAGTSTTETIVSPAKIKAAIDANGSSPVKAWVNFDGTGTVSIRESFNVSSITDNGTGDYTVNFSSPLASADYAILATTSGNTLGAGGVFVTAPKNTAPSASSARIQVNTFNANQDGLYVNFAALL